MVREASNSSRSRDTRSELRISAANSGHGFATVTLGNARNGRFDDGGTEGSQRATNLTIRARSSPFSRALLLSPSHGRVLSSSPSPSLSVSLRHSPARVALVAAVPGRRWRGGQNRDTQDFRGFTIGCLLRPRWSPSAARISLDENFPRQGFARTTYRLFDRFAFNAERSSPVGGNTLSKRRHDAGYLRRICPLRRARWTSQQVVERGQRAAACLEKEKKRERVGARGRQTAPARGRETPLA